MRYCNGYMDWEAAYDYLTSKFARFEVLEVYQAAYTEEGFRYVLIRVMENVWGDTSFIKHNIKEKIIGPIEINCLAKCIYHEFMKCLYDMPKMIQKWIESITIIREDLWRSPLLYEFQTFECGKCHQSYSARTPYYKKYGTSDLFCQHCFESSMTRIKATHYGSSWKFVDVK